MLAGQARMIAFGWSEGHIFTVRIELLVLQECDCDMAALIKFSAVSFTVAMDLTGRGQARLALQE